MAKRKGAKKQETFAAIVGRAMRRAAKAARMDAKLHGTAIALMRDGRVVLVKS